MVKRWTPRGHTDDRDGGVKPRWPMFGCVNHDYTPRSRRTFFMALSLVYLVYPGSAVHDGDQRFPVWLAYAVLAVFVGLYLGLASTLPPWDRAPSWITWTLLTCLTALVITASLVGGPNWVGLAMYVGVSYALALPERLTLPGMAAAVALIGVLGLAAHLSLAQSGFLTFQAGLVGLMMLAFRNSRNLVMQLRAARDEVARLAANEERLRIARDLHDLLGHSLSLIVLKSELARRLAERDGRSTVTAEIADIEAVARRALGEVRDTVTGYRQRSLSEELDNARTMLTTGGVAATVRSTGTPLPDTIDGLLAWAVREGATNVVRHAGATHVDIDLAWDGMVAHLVMTDDGTADGAAGSSGHGLAGLSERVAAAGGALEAGPRIGGGFRLALRLPAGAGDASKVVRVSSPA